MLYIYKQYKYNIYIYTVIPVYPVMLIKELREFFFYELLRNNLVPYVGQHLNPVHNVFESVPSVLLNGSYLRSVSICISLCMSYFQSLSKSRSLRQFSIYSYLWCSIPFFHQSHRWPFLSKLVQLFPFHFVRALIWVSLLLFFLKQPFVGNEISLSKIYEGPFLRT